jgi:phosphatidylserine/phosphatidylglycerophosphate/cardiolipin synthase-like enzyme
MDNIVTYSAFAVTGVLCSAVSFRLYEWNKNRRHKPDESANSIMEDNIARDERKPPEIWNTALFFPDPLYPVGVKFTATANEFPEIPDSQTYKFLKYFKEARISISICIQLASFSPLEKILTEKCRAGFIVSIITDHDTTEAHNNFLIIQLKKHARGRVQIRKRNFGHLMHNKFAIIDDEALLTGSMNWTQQGFRGNYEDILITTHPKIVQDYIKEFSKIWRESEEF